jgi:simple sugar transport system ATP-binding protein
VATRVLATAADGAAVVWIGAELDELLRVSDRIVVLCTGNRPREFSRPYDRHAIGLAMAGVAA